MVGVDEDTEFGLHDWAQRNIYKPEDKDSKTADTETSSPDKSTPAAKSTKEAGSGPSGDMPSANEELQSIINPDTSGDAAKKSDAGGGDTEPSDKDSAPKRKGKGKKSNAAKSETKTER